MNVSEGRDAAVLSALATAAGDSLLDVHTDPDHHRSVFTLVGEHAPRTVAERAVELIEEAPGVAVSGESFARVGVLDEDDRPSWANATRELVDTGDSARSIVARRRSGEAAVLHVDD